MAPATSEAAQEAVAALCAMGFPRDAALTALQLAGMNVERAAEYLADGIPQQASPHGPPQVGATLQPQQPALTSTSLTDPD